MEKELGEYLIPELVDITKQYTADPLKRVIKDIKYYTRRALHNKISIIHQIRICEWNDNKLELIYIWFLRLVY